MTVVGTAKIYDLTIENVKSAAKLATDAEINMCNGGGAFFLGTVTLVKVAVSMVVI